MTVPIEFGRDLLPRLVSTDDRWLVLTTAPLLNTVQRQLATSPDRIVAVPDTDEPTLQAWERDLPPAGAILGIGGGVCMDAAKYVAWRRGLPLTLVPSIVSVDACLTEAIAVRRDGRVRYIGEVYPRKLAVDFALIQSAPAHLNRAGAGDILSIHTALWDWQLAAERRGEMYDAQIAEQSAGLLDRLSDAADEVRAVSETGIRTLIDLFAAEVELCRRIGNSRPEEGSEHFWAYNVEYRTRRDYIHGELVALGVLLMATLQENAVGKALQLIDRLGIRWRPQDVGLTHEEIVETLATAKQYAESERLAYSVINARPLSREAPARIVQQLCREP